MAHMITRYLSAFALLFAFALPATAQDDDGEGFLTRLIQDSLSGTGRVVDITGFQGALSSRATLDRLTIADEDGVWLDLRDAVLDWNRSALLRGRLEVNELTAGSITLTRLPEAEETGPAPEATGFSIPDLPVSVRVDRISAGSVTLGESIVGEAVTLSLEGSAQLAGGAADVDIAVTRTDRPGQFRLDAAYDPAEAVLDLDLALQEPEGGLAAKLMSLPGEPSVDLTLAGSGPLDDYRAELDLDTDGEDRLAGVLNLAANDTGGRDFSAGLGGDVTALILPQYRDFFGPDVSLRLEGTRDGDGAVSLDTLELGAAALSLTGRAALNAEGQPRLIDVQGRIASDDGARVDLPFGDGISVSDTTLSVFFDAADDDAIDGEFAITGLQVPGYAAERVALNLDGAITLGETPAFGGDVTFDATGLQPDDPALAEALGPEITGSARVDWEADTPVRITGLDVTGESYGAQADMLITPQDGTTTINLDGRAQVQRLAAFAPLTGTDLRGAADLSLNLQADLVGGTFDIRAQGGTDGLALGIEAVDPLISPPATLTLDADRTTEGLTITTFELSNEEFSVSAAGSLANNSGQIDYALRLENAGVFTGAESGPVELDGTAEMRPGGLHVSGLGSGDDLRTGIEPADRLLAGGATFTYAVQTGETMTLENLRLSTDQAEISASGNLTPGARNVEAALTLRNSALFTGGQAGPVSLQANVTETPQGAYRVRADGEGTDIGIGNAQVDPLFAGETILSLDLLAGERIVLNALRLANAQLTLTAEGDLTEGAREITLDGRLANSAIFTGGTAGPLDLDATVTQTGDGYRVEADGTGTDLGIGNPQVDPLLAGRTDLRVVLRAGERILLDTLRVENPQLTLGATGELTEGARSLTADLRLANTAIFTGGQAGPLQVTAEVRQEGEAYIVSVDGTGQDIGIGNPQLDALLAGQSDLVVEARIEGQTVALNRFVFDGTALEANASGTVAPDEIDLTLAATLDNLARLAPGLDGPLTVNGDVGRAGDTTRLDLRMQGPGGTTANVSGRVALPGGAVDLDIDGQAPLALANAFIAPQSITGTARFDLRMDGQPSPAALSGQVNLSGARLVLPEAQQIVEDIGGTITLSGGRASLDITASLGGGRLAVSGGAGLSAPYSGDIDVSVDRVRVERAGLVSTVLNGQVGVNGPLTGGAQITGTIGLSDTEVRIPSGGFGGVEPVPDMRHVGLPSDVRRTLARADLLDRNGGGSGGGGRPFGLDLLIRTDTSIFIRGRGLDAEMEGQVRLGGTTNDVRPVGTFDLVRGRLNILTKRLDLVEGRLRLAGAFDPLIRLVARNRGTDYTIDIIVEGPVTAPDVTFTSQPELPQDEVLSQLFFERDLASLSVLQAAKLAAAVAELTGKGDGGVVGRIRSSFGLDDLDISQTEEGETSIRAGKYISENVYTDVEVVSSGRTNLSINLDVSDNVTAKGTVSNDGETSLGLFYQKDY
ncbi:MAG: translocation/assembly module TamB domain-containing protein [Pseudooceanicola sp.]